jgi:RNA polymerase sigma-54 factor
MAISQKLHTKLVQKLILTPSLQQAIKLLPMSTLELSELLNQEMVENPMLEEVPTEEAQPAEATQEKAEEKPADKEKGDTWDDQDYEYFFGDYLDDGYRPRTPMEVKELPPIENTLSSSASLSDHLLWQLSMQTDDPTRRAIGEAIIGNPRRRRLSRRHGRGAGRDGAMGHRGRSSRRWPWCRRSIR